MFTGSGGDFLKINTSGSQKGVVFARTFYPSSDDSIDIGASDKQFKDLYIDGTAYIDSLQADSLGAALDANSQAITNINVDSGAIDGTIIGANSAVAGTFAAVVATTMSGSSTLHVGGNVTMAGLGSVAIALTSDMMVIDDGAGGSIKTTSLANYATALAAGPNEGLASTAGRLELDLSDLSTDTVLTAGGGDSLAFVDSGDSNASKNITVSNFLTSIAGAGISVSSGKLVSDSAAAPNAIVNGATANLSEGFNYGNDSGTAVAAVWTLPAPVEVGDIVHVKAHSACSSVLTVTVDGGTIDGSSSVVLESPLAAVSLICIDVASDLWKLY
jgi:hypothetical protein